jgi:hypothetical protein
MSSLSLEGRTTTMIGASGLPSFMSGMTGVARITRPLIETNLSVSIVSVLISHARYNTLEVAQY